MFMRLAGFFGPRMQSSFQLPFRGALIGSCRTCKSSRREKCVACAAWFSLPTVAWTLTLHAHDLINGVYAVVANNSVRAFSLL